MQIQFNFSFKPEQNLIIVTSDQCKYHKQALILTYSHDVTNEMTHKL